MTAQFITNARAPKFEKSRKQSQMDRSTWQEAGALALLYPAIPVEFGGAGGDFGHEAAIIIEIDRAARAKDWLVNTWNDVLDECLQLHGGYGFV